MAKIKTQKSTCKKPDSVLIFPKILTIALDQSTLCMVPTLPSTHFYKLSRMTASFSSKENISNRPCIKTPCLWLIFKFIWSFISKGNGVVMGDGLGLRVLRQRRNREKNKKDNKAIKL